MPAPVAATTTDAPAIGLAFASRAVTVIVAEPLAVTIELGVSTTVDRVAETGPATTA